MPAPALSAIPASYVTHTAHQSIRSQGQDSSRLRGGSTEMLTTSQLLTWSSNRSRLPSKLLTTDRQRAITCFSRKLLTLVSKSPHKLGSHQKLH